MYEKAAFIWHRWNSLIKREWVRSKILVNYKWDQERVNGYYETMDSRFFFHVHVQTTEKWSSKTVDT